jgi:HK97 gp10 family phage protein
MPVIVLQGAKALERKLKQLPAKAEANVWRQGLRAGAKIIQSQAVADAPKKSGFLAKNIKVRAMKRKKGRIGILVQTSKGFYRGDDFYAAFQELGFHIGARRLVAARRFIAGRHYMDHAFKSKSQQAADVTLATMKAGIEREAAAR